jgi:hypothetical protein
MLFEMLIANLDVDWDDMDEWDDARLAQALEIDEEFGELSRAVSK